VKLPRDISGTELAKRLQKLGYVVTRQTGSHQRLTKRSPEGDHHITIPAHKTLKVGTLSSILSEIAGHHKTTKEDLIEQVFGK